MLERAEAFDRLALPLLNNQIPLVDHDYQRAAGIEYGAGEGLILLGHTIDRINNQKHDIGRFHRMLRAHTGEELHWAIDLGLGAQTGSISHAEFQYFAVLMLII